MKFPQRPPDIPKPNANPHVDKQTPPKEESAAPQREANAPRAQAVGVPESRYNFSNMFSVPAEHVKEEICSLDLFICDDFFFILLNIILCFSILEKAGTALEVLRDVLDTVDTQHPEVFTVGCIFVC